MSPAPIDPVAVARAIIADPRKKFTMSVLQIEAICKALVDTADNPQPVISTELAEAAQAHIAAELLGSTLAADEAREAAFNTFKTAFETEFPQ